MRKRTRRKRPPSLRQHCTDDAMCCQLAADLSGWRAVPGREYNGVDAANHRHPHRAPDIRPSAGTPPASARLGVQLAPGQAILVKAGWGLEPYLRRTFHAIAIDDETWTLRVPPGGDWGHAWLRAAPLGAELDCLGPVGIGFSLPANARNVLCLGEGDAAWALLPVIALADTAGVSVTLAVEAFTGRELLPAQRLPATVEYHTALSANAADRARLRRRAAARRRGPVPAGAVAVGRYCHGGRIAGVLRCSATAVRAARFELTHGFAQVLYPATFLCGVGACQACVADLHGGRQRICQRARCSIWPR